MGSRRKQGHASKGKGKRRTPQRTESVPRDPPPAVKQFLRQEVHYACPVPGCGSPLLEWHHFDPKWREKHHQNPDGMIALCTKCHPRADLGTWTKEQLHSFKRNPQPLGLIRETFGWAERSVLYRLGGVYAADNNAGVLAVRGQRILWHERSAEGRLLFSLDLFGERGDKLLTVRQNCLSVDASRIHDLSLNAGATHLRIWLGERKPGIDLRFRRLSLDQLRAILRKDAEHAGKPPKVPELPHWMKSDAGSSESGLPGKVESFTLEYASQHCLDSDGTVTLVDIARGKFRFGGGLVEVFNDSVRFAGGDGQVRFSGSFKNGGFGFNLD